MSKSKFLADLHIHSRFSRATSKELTLPNLYKWGQIKGLGLVGTGDFTHPVWFQEIQDNLEPVAETGLFQLKPEIAKKVDETIPAACRRPLLFMLTVEISNIYKKNGKTRKIHHVVCAPSIEIVAEINRKLGEIGNLASDGRPILGLDSRDMLEILLGISEEIYLIPAHIWTPWFSLFGSKSGFDEIEECFEDLSSYIFAAETGLSSDPVMNWRCSRLDHLTLVSNSDAHSPSKLAREANVFHTEMDYREIFDALKTGDPKRFLGTVEFYPEEGKYHLDGHRKCKLRMSPEETLAYHKVCPVCKLPITVGVMHRVNELADRPYGEKPEKTFPFHSLVGLETALAEIHEVGPKTKTVQKEFLRLTQSYGSELEILQDVPLTDLEGHESPLLMEGIRRIREGRLQIDPGFDGEFGKIKLFRPDERKKLLEQPTFFMDWQPEDPPQEEVTAQPSVVDSSPSGETLPLPEAASGNASKASSQKPSNPEQQQAIAHRQTPLLVVAGPGTGKTHTLTSRIAALIQEGMPAESIVAITFTNQAAQELQERLHKVIGAASREILACTFHQLGQRILREQASLLELPEEFAIYSAADIREMAKWAGPFSCYSPKQLTQLLARVSQAKGELHNLQEIEESELAEFYQHYQDWLQKHGALDIDDLIYRCVELFRKFPDVAKQYQQKIRALAIDEYQDINQMQYAFFRSLVHDQCDLCVIGDGDQAIYGFRGAKIEHFFNFSQDFPEATTIHLTQNYRFSQQLVDLSQALIRHNTKRLALDLQAAQENPPTRIFCYQAATARAEAEFIVHTIEKQMGGTSHFSIHSQRVDDRILGKERCFASFAVLYRSHQQRELLEEAILRSGMPYQIIGGETLLERPKVRLAINLLRAMADSNNALAWLAVIAHLPGVGEQSCDVLYQKLQQETLAQLLQQPGKLRKIPKKTREAIAELYQFVQRIQSEQPATVAKLLEEIWQHKEYQHLLAPSHSEQQILLRLAKNFSQTSQFIAEITAKRDTDTPFHQFDKITLMTLHAAKGREFPVVFIAGCEQGLLPFQRAQEEGKEEEERRLFYVGITRAQEELYLTSSNKRTVWGREQQRVISPFLQELPGELVQEIRSSGKAKSKSKQKQEESCASQEQMEFF